MRKYLLSALVLWGVGTFQGLAQTSPAPGPSPAAPPPPPSLKLKEYTNVLRSFANSPMPNQNLAAMLGIARVELARFPYVRDITIGVMQDAQRMFPGGSGDPFSRSSTGIRSNLANDPKAMERQMAEMNRAREQENARREAARKSINFRLTSLEKIAATPEGQQFSLPLTSRLYQVLRGGFAVAATPKPTQANHETITFEAVSKTEGGIIAFRTRLVRIPRVPGGAEEREERVTEPESYFIKGYTEHVTIGEMLELKVTKGPNVTINRMEIGQYILVK